MYAVWFNMYPGDARSKWPSALLTDPRVAHFWDEEREAGRLYMSQLTTMLARRAPATLPPTEDALWDAFLVYPRGDQWKDPIPFPATWGYPIMVTRDHLIRELDVLAGK